MKLARILIWSLAVSLLPTIALVGPANAALTVDAGNATFSFADKTFFRGNVINTGDGTADGDVVRFNNVITRSGISIDAVVTTTLVNAVGVSASNEVKITGYDPGVTAGYLDLNVQGQSTSSFDGYVNLNFQFFESGTYTGAGTGSQITLNNVSIFSLDVDSGSQFTDFRGFQKYYLNSPTRIRVGETITAGLRATAPYFRFLSGIGASGSNDPLDAVQVDYLSLSSMDVRVGNAELDGGAYFAIGFGQLDWNGGSPGLGTPNPVNNPVNNPPTSSNTSINVPTTGEFILEKRNFGNYQDTDGNAFDKVVITSLPSPSVGKVQKLLSGTWTDISAVDTVTVSAIDSGNLRLLMSGTSGASDANFKFRVNDSLANSTAEYTITLNLVPTPQSITFPNPGTKPLGSAPTYTVITETATASSGLPVTLVSSTTGICTISSGTIRGTGVAGACTVTALQDGNSTYSAASSVTQTFYFSDSTAQTITFGSRATQSLSIGSFTETATASSGLAVTLTSLSSDVCTVSGFIVTLVSAGTCQLRASQAGGTNGATTFAPASPVTQSFLVTSSASGSGDGNSVDATVVPIYYTITFDANTGSGTMSPQPRGAGAGLFNLDPNTFEKTGSLFGGWNTRADGTGVAYPDRAQLVVTGNLRLFAQWTVIKETPTIIWANPASITTKTPLSATQLNASASIPGTYSYTPAAGDLLPAGKQRLNVLFTPTDATKYTAASAQVEIVVTELLIPTIIWANPASITTKTPLSATQLNASASIPGTYSYTPTTGTLLPAGKQRLNVLFTPTDATKYTAASAQVEIVVTELLVPTIIWANPEEIVYGTLLGDVQLNASSVVPGTFDYGSQKGKLLPLGRHVLTTRFMPQDAQRFAEVTAQVEILVVEKLIASAAPIRTKVDQSGKTTVLGLPLGTTIVVTDLGTGLKNANVGNYELTVAPASRFSGTTNVSIRATLGKQSLVLAVPVIVHPEAPASASMTIVTANSTRITWASVDGATNYQVTSGGEQVCNTEATSCVAQRLLGPKSDVRVFALSGAEATSDPVQAIYRNPAKPVLAKVENFATGSFRLANQSRQELREFADRIKALGLTRLQVQGHTDIRGGVDNTVLSRNRAQATVDFLSKLLPDVEFKIAYFASTNPVASNSTKQGLAANRRVEIAIW